VSPSSPAPRIPQLRDGTCKIQPGGSPRTLGPLTLRSPISPRDRVRVDELGAARVAELSVAEAGTAARTVAQVRALDGDMCKVDVVVSGRAVIEQDGREAELGAGDLAFVDLSRPARWAMSPARLCAVVFPRSLLPLAPGELSQVTGMRIAPDRGAAALASSFVRRIGQEVEDAADVERARLGSVLIDLLAVSLSSRVGRPELVAGEVGDRAMTAQVLDYIEQRLPDPRLSPTMIAEANAISVRLLHRLFEGQESTVAAWIRRRRVERCAADLRNPARAAVPVSAIGARWGLPDPALFSRVFRSAYGVPPSEYRAAAQPGSHE
jgi:AraC-like DNA-binding protein